MKKIISLIIVAVLLLSQSVVCFAEAKNGEDNEAVDPKKISTIKDENRAQIDLTGMSYEELVALKDKINFAMWNSEEWQEVTVPQGVWVVGEDIPVGHWTISAADGAYAMVCACNKLDETQKSADYNVGCVIEHLMSKSNTSFNENSDVEFVDFELTDWKYIVVDYGSVVFTPYEGKQSLSFK